MVLRRWLPADAPAMHDAVSHSVEHLRPWMAWIAFEPQTVADRRRLIRRFGRVWRRGGDVVMGIFVDGRVVGGTGLHRRLGPDGLEIGYWIAAGHTGRGHATAAARLLTTAAFGVPGIARVEIHHDQANRASAAVPRRLGYRFVGAAPDAVKAPAETGIDWTWRVTRDEWAPGAGVDGMVGT